MGTNVARDFFVNLAAGLVGDISSPAGSNEVDGD
jgi:hypothetical protein